MTVLILEDDPKIADFVKKGLREAGFHPEVSYNGEEGLALALQGGFDLMIADIMLPERDGLSVVEELRKNGNDLPVIFLTAKRSVDERVEGLRRGADDYLTKPFSISELVVRCLVILKRAAKQLDSHRLCFKDLELDLLQRTVKRAGEHIELQQKEFALLEQLLRNQGNVMTKSQILEKVWSYDFDPQTNVVDVLVCRLRNKVDRNHPQKIIKTIRGVGYTLRDD